MENIDEKKLDYLIKCIKKIEGFDFTIDSFIMVKNQSEVAK
jgi:hypothetical protein